MAMAPAGHHGIGAGALVADICDVIPHDQPRQHPAAFRLGRADLGDRFGILKTASPVDAVADKRAEVEAGAAGEHNPSRVRRSGHAPAHWG